MTINSDVINWLWKHSHYPTTEKNGKFWIGMLGPYSTRAAAVRAAIRLESKEARK